MKQLQLFNDKEYLDPVIELKQMIKTIISQYENENSCLYCDTDTMIELIKMLIIF